MHIKWYALLTILIGGTLQSRGLLVKIEIKQIGTPIQIEVPFSFKVEMAGIEPASEEHCR